MNKCPQEAKALSSDFFEPVFTNHRFECVGYLDDIDIPMDHDNYVYRIRDTETGVNYICIAGHYRASICPMYDADGQVVMTDWEWIDYE